MRGKQKRIAFVRAGNKNEENIRAVDSFMRSLYRLAPILIAYPPVLIFLNSLSKSSAPAWKSRNFFIFPRIPGFLPIPKESRREQFCPPQNRNPKEQFEHGDWANEQNKNLCSPLVLSADFFPGSFPYDWDLAKNVKDGERGRMEWKWKEFQRENRTAR